MDAERPRLAALNEKRIRITFGPSWAATILDFLAVVIFAAAAGGALWVWLNLAAAPGSDYPCSYSATSVLPACPAEPLR